MMELTNCAFIVTCVSLVTATPYGYGVKGGAGASSSAGSAAAVGSFGNRGDIPLPFGSSFSGSFSKAASSSSSSSSASSSSSSFTYNGSTGGIFSSPGTNGNAGCTTGICQNSGHNEPSGVSTDFNSYNAANSGAIAGSGTGTGANCQGTQCSGNSGKCSTGQCPPILILETPASGYDAGKKCSSRQCGTTSNPSPPLNEDSDDIHFEAHSLKAAQDAKDSSFKGKATGYNSGYDCQNGNCGSSYTNNPSVGHGSSTPYPATLTSKVTPGYNAPATHLETPNLVSGCSSGVCSTGQHSSPTSYNNPIHGTPAECGTPGCHSDASTPGLNPHNNNNNQYDSSGKRLPVYTGGFGGPAGMLKPNEFNTPTSKPVSFENPPYSGSGTTSNNKPIYTGGFGGPAGMLKPDEYDIKVPIHSSNPSYNNHLPTGSVGCTTPNCNGYSPKPAVESSSKLPPYTGGFGGPIGILKPNEFNVPISPMNNPVSPTTSSSFIPDCTTTNCIGSPTFISGSSTTANSGSYNGGGSTSYNKPVYTGGFGGPAGMLKPDEFDIKVPVHSSTPSYNNHLSTPGCATPNCNGYASKPSSESSGKLPPYTSSFGGPPGILKPNEYNVPYSMPSLGVKPITASTLVSSGHTSNYRPIGVTYNGPPAVAPITPNYAGVSPVACKTGNCAGYPHIGSVPSGSYENPSNCKSGNCGSHSSTGSDSKSEIDRNTSSGLYGHTAECETGKCHSPTNGAGSGSHNIKYPSTGLTPPSPQDNHGSVLPLNTELYSGDSKKCKSSNCADSVPTNSGTNVQSGAYSGSKEKLPVYTGGFGGPPGLLKPNDFSKPDSISTSNKPISQLPGSSTPACSYGNCKTKESSPSSGGHNVGFNGAHVTASSTASANAVAYSGGFGGPPGFLKPYDNGKEDLALTTGGPNQGKHYGGSAANKPVTDSVTPTGTPSNIGSIGGNNYGGTAFSGSAASANSGSFGYNTQGSGANGGSPCGGGCGGGYHSGLQGSGSSAVAGAKSIASSGAIGFGGSFASSSASAHSSAGSYTKGGYGKR